MVNVICLKWGTKYKPKYVNILQAMVKRNLTIPHRFICFTEDATDLNCETKPLLTDDQTIKGWWHKVCFYQQPLYDVTGPTLFLDLDVVIVDNIDSFFTDKPEADLRIMNEFHQNKKYQSSVFRLNIGSHKYSYVWDNFLTARPDLGQGIQGDQDWVSLEVNDAVMWPDAWCRSFKYHCCYENRKVGPARNPNTVYREHESTPVDSKIIIFHGRPDPHEAIEGKILTRYLPAPWIANHWKL